eukprot:TRINITY_DN15228_c0_g1_i1.p1 TRINITY_DN15228_c0_g1~~TRINITY_DN15228_c0_g1_i1.p1  ORF type:complete len:264 (-),score=52.69 TRINITY_DN15228_c0_g1_i1:231-1022(-)
MYDESEFQFRDVKAFEEAKKIISNQVSDLSLDQIPILSYNIVLTIEVNTCGIEQKCRVKLFVTYPPQYPYVVARCYVDFLSIKISRQQYKLVESKLQEIQQETIGFPCIVKVVDWLETCSLEIKTPEEKKLPQTQIFVREWFWFHHLYSKEKRRLIIKWAKDGNLTGFSLAGKPGLVCVEGGDSNISEFYTKLHSLSWKKLSSKLKETQEVQTLEELNHLRKFEDLYEWDLGGTGRHPNLGNLKKELEILGLSEKFDEIFQFG